MEYRTRVAEPEDLEVVQDLSVQLSEKEAEEFDDTIDPEWNKTGEAGDYFRERITNGRSFAVVAEKDEQVVGYAVGGIHESEEYRKNLDIAELESMYVLPEYRSHGIGTEFVERFERWAEEHNVERLRVEVTSQNKKGIRFYENNGLEDYARTMEKEL